MVIVVNQLDHDKSNFDKVIEQAKDKLSKKTTIIQYPINEGNGFNAFIDVLLMKKFEYKDGKAEITEIPKDQLARAEELRSELIEKGSRK